jgi:hypothetical protein
MARDDSGGDGARFDARRRRVLVGACSAFAAAVAGCQSDDGGPASEDQSTTTATPVTAAATGTPNPTDDESTDTPTEDDEQSAEVPTGSVQSNVIDEFEIVDYNAEYGESFGERELYVSVTVQNNGDRTLENFTGYTMKVFFYDTDGNEVNFDKDPAHGTYVNKEIPPGETVQVAYDRGPADDSDAHPDDVASYEFTLDCSEAFEEGVYCP